MARLIVHAGTHKTGTTAIQRALFTERERLRDAGLVYDPGADLFGKPSYAHHKLVHRLADRPGRHEEAFALYRARIEAELAQGRDVVISAEPFYRQTCPAPGRSLAEARARYIEKMRAFFDGLPVEIVLVFRRPDALLVSLFKENAANTDLAVPDMAAFIAVKQLHARYGDRLTEFEAAFGPARVLRFETLRETGLVRSFLAEIGFGHLAIAEPPALRESVPLRAALWLMAAKTANPAMSRAERGRRWYYALSRDSAPEFRGPPGESLWRDTAQRDSVFDAAMAGFGHPEFWSRPTSEFIPAAWDAAHQRAAEQHYAEWCARHSAWLQLRESLKLAPYQPDSQVGLADRVLRLPMIRARAALRLR